MKTPLTENAKAKERNIAQRLKSQSGRINADEDDTIQYVESELRHTDRLRKNARCLKRTHAPVHKPH